jgi:RNA polymerase sigma-70 factor (ECF subfamily)
MNPGAAVVLRYEAKIAHFFEARVGSPEDAEDLISEAVCAVMESYPRFQGRSSVSTWVYAVCRNTLYRYYRGKSRQRLLYERTRGTAGRSTEQRARLREAAETLPGLYRRLYEQRYVQGRKLADIAGELERPEGTVKYLCYDLRRRLARILKNDG